jgi:hypothetical protein
VTDDLMGRLRQSLSERRASIVHWIGDAPTSLHGNGASASEHTTRNSAEVTCRLCLTLLAREAVPADTTGEQA